MFPVSRRNSLLIRYFSSLFNAIRLISLTISLLGHKLSSSLAKAAYQTTSLRLIFTKMDHRSLDLALPTADDPEADEFYARRIVGCPDTIVPCRWGLLDNAKTRQDVRDLVFCALVGIQTLAFQCFGGKIPHLFDEHGLSVLDWPIDLSQDNVSDSLSATAPACKLIMYFIRTFGQLQTRYGRSEAVDMVDGIVTRDEGVACIVDFLIQYASQRSISAAELKSHTCKARIIILGESDFSMENNVVLKPFRDFHANDFCLSQVQFAKRPTAEILPEPLKMLALALQGYLWRTDHESSSILQAVCGDSVTTIGSWEPLTRFERGQLVDAIDGDGNFRVIGTEIWVRRIWGIHSLVRREVFYERCQSNCKPFLGFRGMETCEQSSLSRRTANLLTWMRDEPQEWAEDLFNDMLHIKNLGYTAESQEMSKAIETARRKAEIRHGEDDCFNMMFGPIQTTYSFACESGDMGNFARLHYRRCLRIVGPCTLVDGVPLHALNSLDGLSAPMSSIVKDVSELDPVVNYLKGRSTPELNKPWKTELMW